MSQRSVFIHSTDHLVNIFIDYLQSAWALNGKRETSGAREMQSLSPCRSQSSGGEGQAGRYLQHADAERHLPLTFVTDVDSLQEIYKRKAYV